MARNPAARRPRLGPGRPRTRRAALALSREEYVVLSAAARRAGLSLGAFCRDVALVEALRQDLDAGRLMPPVEP